MLTYIIHPLTLKNFIVLNATQIFAHIDVMASKFYLRSLTTDTSY